MSHLMVKKSQFMFFRGRECVFYNLNIYVCGQLVDMCDSATHLGHFITCFQYTYTGEFIVQKTLPLS